MPSVSGIVNEALEALVILRLIGGNAADLEIECVIDTGFDGALVLPSAIIERLGLPIISHEVFAMVGDTYDSADIALAQIEWLGTIRRVDVIVKDDYLLGTALLDRATLRIDYASRSVRISV
jgi:clan AA aspartic protease